MNLKRNYIKFLVIFALLVIVFVLLSLFWHSKREEEVFLGGKTFSMEIADTDLLREHGLSGHKPLSDRQGMIFIFNKPDLYGFWMKDMLFPLDIIWLDENFKINHIEKSVLPETYPKVFYPEEKSLYVLEVSAGSMDSLGVKVGDYVRYVKN